MTSAIFIVQWLTERIKFQFLESCSVIHAKSILFSCRCNEMYTNLELFGGYHGKM